MSSSTPIENTAGNDFPARRGHLKIFLGYAAGVGKTFRMLEEGQQLKHQGADVVVGYFEPHGRQKTIAKTVGLEIIPRRTISYRGATFEEMDTSAILERRPAICLVDELAHTNIPGLERPKRWEDVHVLLDAGIDVFTTLNVQHLESLNDKVYEISGVRVRETVPDWVVKQADEVVMVDATTGALLNRLQRGDVYAPEQAQRALENFFKETTLSALRELALRHTALELELREEESALASEALQSISEAKGPAIPTSVPAEDRILIHVTADPRTAILIRRGRRVADFLGAQCFAVHVSPNARLDTLSMEECEAVERHLNFARNLHIETRILQGKDPAQTIVDFAHRNQITQILLARPRYSWWTRLLGTELPHRIIKRAKNVRVAVVAERRQTH
jgi:two-component system sensor histidine kinase KdpD